MVLQQVIFTNIYIYIIIDGRSQIIYYYYDSKTNTKIEGGGDYIWMVRIKQLFAKVFMQRLM